MEVPADAEVLQGAAEVGAYKERGAGGGDAGRVDSEEPMLYAIDLLGDEEDEVEDVYDAEVSLPTLVGSP